MTCVLKRAKGYLFFIYSVLHIFMNLKLFFLHILKLKRYFPTHPLFFALWNLFFPATTAAATILLKEHQIKLKYKQYWRARFLLCMRSTDHFRTAVSVMKPSWWQMVRLSLEIFHLNMSGYIEIPYNHWGS